MKRSWVMAMCILACQPRTDKPSALDAGAACTRVGQRCELSPGKLGTCVQRDDCTTEPCLTCQSQH